MNDRPQIIRTQTEIELDLGQWLENRERYVAQSAASKCGGVAPLPSIEEVRAAAEAAAPRRAA
jgi:hypothetical protein